MSRRKQRLAEKLGRFMGEYGRKKRPGNGEPNDRKYDRKIEHVVKRMDPRELDELLRGDEPDEPKSVA